MPVRCVLASEDALLSVEVETLQPCNRKTTCQLTCQDGSKQYIDLKNFNSPYKNQYTQYCHSENPTEWKEATVNKILAAKKLGVTKFQVTKKVDSILDKVFTKFSKICHGGQQVTNQDVQSVIAEVGRDLKDARARANSSPRDATVLYNQRAFEEKIMLAEDDLQILSVVEEAVKEFQIKFNSGSFKYCDCRAFAASIGQTNWFNTNVVSPFCPSDVVVKPVVVNPIMKPNVGRRPSGSRSRREIVATLSDEIDQEIRALENEMEEFE
jgi:hypothetical protein